jgi:2-C-methyl-D-erythritol 4-phosphate cytidylyltransferase
MMSSTWGVVVASGKSEKFGAEFDTAFLNVMSRPVVTYALERFEQCPEIDGVVVVAPKDRVDSLRGIVQVFGYNKVKAVVAGTSQRQTSVLAGLDALDESAGYVSIHDGSRPCISTSDIVETLKSAKRYGSGVLAVRIADSVKLTKKGSNVAKPVEGEALWVVHTPQAYKVELIRKGLETAQKKKITVEDDSEALSLINEEVRLVEADGPRVKISSAADMSLAELFLRR